MGLPSAWLLKRLCAVCIICVLVFSGIDMTDDVNWQGDYSTGVVQFNNPKLLRELEKSLEDSPMFDRTQEAVDPNKIGGVDLKSKAGTLGYRFRMLCIEEMAVSHMQNIYDSLQYDDVHPDINKKLEKLSTQVKDKFNAYLETLRSLKLKVENLYNFHVLHPITAHQHCCDFSNDMLRYEAEYDLHVSHRCSCDLIPPNLNPASFNPGRNLTEAFQSNELNFPSIAWQYFISVDGIHNEYPAHNFHNRPYVFCKAMHNVRHREIFVSTLHPAQKHIVIVLDHGASMSVVQMKTAKAIAKYLIASLDTNDKVNILAMSSTIKFASDESCLSEFLMPLTSDLKQLYNYFIDSLTISADPTNHTAGISKAFHVLRNTLRMYNSSNTDAHILYISRGLMTDLSESRDVLDIINKESATIANNIYINTYAVVDHSKPIIWEKDFLHNIASQTLTSPGKMRAINSTRDLNVAIGDFYRASSITTPDRPVISLPYKDPIGKSLVMSLSWPCFHGNKALGMVGLDVHHGDLMEAISYYGTGDARTMGSGAGEYAFLMDMDGIILSHPALGRPIGLNRKQQTAAHTDIAHFEPYDGFMRIRSLMLQHTAGVQHLDVPRYVDNITMIHMQHLLPKHVNVTYTWKQLQFATMSDVHYVLVIKTITDVLRVKEISVVSVPRSEPLLVYHRLDLLPSDNTCMHLKQLASTDTSALFLAARSFTRPFEYISQHETKRMVQGYLAYINDNTKLINNPVIKEVIKNDVAVLSRINQPWLRIIKNSRQKNYIIRRSVATPNGAFVVYPATLMNQAYDPTTQEWFTRAMQNPGKVTLTAPYLDHGGAGYIVTISHTIYEGKNGLHGLHGPLDRIVAVMGMDVTLGYFYKLLISEIPVCEEQNIRCFIMDDRGYLIAHDSLIEPTGRSPVEQQHIIHKEHVVANDILSHTGFVQKKVCNSYLDRTVQRYYHFNSSMKDIVTNLVHGEQCSHYQITAIPGTNTFVGIVNQTCKDSTAFCPCSMVDRLCLNCLRMEQSECECPCECPMSVNHCTGQLSDPYDESNPACGPRADDVPRAELPDRIVKALPQCMQSHCARRKTKIDCLGVLDCEWCVFDTDGTTRLSQPFCSTQRVCFAGVLEAVTPYHDEINAAAHQDKRVSVTSTPIGPVAGGIMGCFLVLLLGIYWYKRHIHQGNRGAQYVPTIQMAEGDIPMPALEHDMDQDPEISEEPSTVGHTNIVLATFDTPSVSPYKVNTSYQRPSPQIGDSDHGYSTMTPHETDNNSENASTTTSVRCGPIIGRDRYRPPGLHKQPTGSIDIDGITTIMPMLPPPPSANRRSPTPPGNGQTQIPGMTSVCVHKHPSIPEQGVLGVLVDTSLPETGAQTDKTLSSGPQTGQTVLDHENDTPCANLVTTTVQVHAH